MTDMSIEVKINANSFEAGVAVLFIISCRVDMVINHKQIIEEVSNTSCVNILSPLLVWHSVDNCF